MSTPRTGARTLRRYDSTRRLEQARRTRAAVHTAAFELFSERGYVGTTLAEVAARAGVSVETVQKMGPKSALLDGARLVAVFDTTELDDIRDAEFMQAVAAQPDFGGAADVLTDFYARSNRRAARFWLTWQAAALDDPVVAEAWAAEMASARSSFVAGIDFAAGRGWLRTDVDRDELVATLWLLASAETYLRLTRDAGLSDATYRRWLRRSLDEQLAPRP